MKLIYLAAPYSHAQSEMREARFKRINECAAVLMQAGLYVFSPISHTHPIAMAGGLPTGWDYWEGYDRAMIGACGAICVLQLPGVVESTGVRAEMKIAADLLLPTFMLDDDVDCWRRSAEFLRGVLQ